MNLKEIKEIIALMNEHNLTEIELEKDGQKIRLKKSVLQSGEQIIEKTILTQVQPQLGGPAAISPKEEVVTPKLIEIKAPIVGTFYRAPSPDAEPFVETGQNVEVGQVICIIEAMKLMNEIKSDYKGRIVEILAENGDPVEFSQVIFLLEPT